MTWKVDHIAILVRDLEEALDFYKKLGFKVAHTDEEERYVSLKRDQVTIDLYGRPERARWGVQHIAISVDSDKEIQELTEKGVEFEGPPVVAPYTGRTVAKIKEPDGSNWRWLNWTGFPWVGLQLVAADKKQTKRKTS